MEKELRRWTKWANDCQCKHDDKLKELEDKRTKSCKLQGIIKKAIPNVIADCNNLLATFPMSLVTYNKEVYPDIKAGTIVAKCLSFMNEVSNINQRREFEKDTAEKKAERARELENTKNTKTGDEFNELVALIAGKEQMYFPNGLYERYIEVCDTPEYKLLRKIEESNVDNKDITLYYQAVCLYVALENERQEIEKEIQWQGSEPEQQEGTDVPPSEENTLKQQFYESLDKSQKDMVDKYFPRAVASCFMKEIDDGYRWKKGRTQPTQQSIFIHKVLRVDERNPMPIPYGLVGKVFGVRGKDIYNLFNKYRGADNPQTKEDELNEKIFYD